VSDHSPRRAAATRSIARDFRQQCRHHGGGASWAVTILAPAIVGGIERLNPGHRADRSACCNIPAAGHTLPLVPMATKCVHRRAA